jgi:hypothetical protein
MHGTVESLCTDVVQRMASNENSDCYTQLQCHVGSDDIVEAVRSVVEELCQSKRFPLPAVLDALASVLALEGDQQEDPRRYRLLLEIVSGCELTGLESDLRGPALRRQKSSLLRSLLRDGVVEHLCLHMDEQLLPEVRGVTRIRRCHASML